MLKKLINRKVIISIGEPWNFISDAGKNILKGNVSLVSNDNEMEWLKCDVSTFYFGKYKIRSIIAVKRYAKQSLESLLNNEKVIANFLYEPTGKELGINQIKKIFKKKVEINFLVGSIKLISIAE